MNRLNVEELLETAIKSANVGGFRDYSFLGNLKALVLGVNNRDDFILEKAPALREEILRLLKNRLWTEKDYEEHPEIDDQALLPPIVIACFPRTGTTKLLRLLGVTDAFQNTPYWQVHMPARIPGLPDGGKAKRIEITQQYCDWLVQNSPQTQQSHFLNALEPEEETFLIEHCFQSENVILQHNAPEYIEWIITNADPAIAYDYLIYQLKYLQWQFPGDRPRPWILKSPGHMGMEDQLLRAFPQGLKIISCHRDPKEIIPSLCNLVAAYKGVYYRTQVDSSAMGQDVLNRLVYLMDKHISWRDANPAVDILDLGYNEIDQHSLETADKIYDFLGQPLTPESRQKIESWGADNPRHKYGKPDNALERFGLSADQVDTSFAAYINRYHKYL